MNYQLTIIFSGTLLCLSTITIISHQSSVVSPEETYSESVTKGIGYDYVSVADEDSYDDMNEFFDTVGMDHMSRAINPGVIMALLNLFGIPKIFDLKVSVCLSTFLNALANFLL